jgi:hypothetical protein
METNIGSTDLQILADGIRSGVYSCEEQRPMHDFYGRESARGNISDQFLTSRLLFDQEPSLVDHANDPVVTALLLNDVTRQEHHPAVSVRVQEDLCVLGLIDS